jgi:uncharacterized protein
MNEDAIERLYDEFHTPVHVRAHCLQVARVGRLLAEKLAENNENVDPELVWIAGLAHDFIRVVDFKDIPADLGDTEDHLVWKKIRETYSGHHADIGADILEEIGEEVLAKIIRKHKHTAIQDDPPKTWEEKIIYYADKRVTHNDIVDVAERLDEGFARHFPGQEVPSDEIKRREKITVLEKEIFDKIDLEPQDIRSALGED